jgi:hypothetical protein
MGLRSSSVTAQVEQPIGKEGKSGVLFCKKEPKNSFPF